MGRNKQIIFYGIALAVIICLATELHFISFGRAFRIGLSVTLIASTIYMLGWMIEYYVFFPDFYDKSEIHSMAKLKAAGATLSQIQAKTQDYDQLKHMISNPLVHALMTYIEILPVGLLVSLIAALVLERKPGNARVAIG